MLGVSDMRNTRDNGFIIIGGANIIYKSSILIIKTDSSFNAPPISGISNNTMSEISNEFRLLGNYPNPFNSSTVIKFSIPENGIIRFRIFDITGKDQLNIGGGNFKKGLNGYQFDAGRYRLSSGVYLYSIEYNGQLRSNKLVYIK